ncbi:MAG: SH3 domain-containing protein [Chloroflexota bacterium]
MTASQKFFVASLLLVGLFALSVPMAAAQDAGTCAELDAQENPVARVGVPGEAVSSGGVGCFVIHDGTKFVQNAGAIGDIGLIRRGVKAAVEVSGVTGSGGVVSFGGNIQVCLRGTGIFIYRSAVDNPRISVAQPAVTRELETGAFTCAIIGTTGTAILIEGDAAPAADDTAVATTTETQTEIIVNEDGEEVEVEVEVVVPLSSTTVDGAVTLSGCRVTTTAMVRMRTEPNTSSDIITRLPFEISLQALSRTPDSDWFNVIYGNDSGWVSGNFLNQSAGCSD